MTTWTRRATESGADFGDTYAAATLVRWVMVSPAPYWFARAHACASVGFGFGAALIHLALVQIGAVGEVERRGRRPVAGSLHPLEDE